MFSKQRVEIPLKDNELYYSGLKNIMLSSVCSSLGVVFYICIVNGSTSPLLDVISIWPMWLWIICCALICFMHPYRIAGWSFRKYNPRLAKVFEILSYITVGSFCSALYDCLVMNSGSSNNIVEFSNPIRTFSVTCVIFFLSLVLFSSFSIAKTKPLN